MSIRRLPSVFYNWVTMIGALLAVVSFVIIILLYLIDVFVQGTTIYLGLLTFIVLPGFMIAGLVLIALGAILEKRKRSHGGRSSFSGLIQIDLQDPRHRQAAIIWIVGTTILLMGTAVGAYRAYQATESVEFCGQLCHSVMNPEFVAYQTSPHARVDCVQCHIGHGADWFVKAKITGAYQVYATLADVYPRPIPTPIQNLRPARETCERCHWPEQFFGARKDVNSHFLSDEANTPYPITMLINIGGGSEALGQVEGIHWHMAIANKIEYIARDSSRHDIGWARMTQKGGEVREFNDTDNPMTPEEIANAEIRTMDCIDCHNRPSHVYRSPIRAVNQGISAGWIDRDLPYIKREAVIALDSEYEDTPAALAGIEKHILEFYTEEYPETLETRRAAVDTAVAVTQRLYQQNFFPEMKVTWKAYPDNIGHSEFIGCFRCHGERLQTENGETITSDCTVCHTILAQGLKPEMGAFTPKGLTFIHPVDVDGAEMEGTCTECHEGGAELY